MNKNKFSLNRSIFLQFMVFLAVMVVLIGIIFWKEISEVIWEVLLCTVIGFAILMLFWLLWGQFGIEFSKDTIIVKKGFSNQLIPTSEIQAICIVHEWKYATRFRRPGLYKETVIEIENGEKKISIEFPISICFITKQIETCLSDNAGPELLYSDQKVKEYFSKHCIITLPYSNALMEEVVQLGAPIYLKTEILMDEDSISSIGMNKVFHKYKMPEPIIQDDIAMIKTKREQIN